MTEAKKPAPVVRPSFRDAVCRCGLPFGKHRHGDAACPNPAWKTGNGLPQWLISTYRTSLTS